MLIATLNECATADEWLGAVHAHPDAVPVKDESSLDAPDFEDLDLEGICVGNEDAPVCADAAVKGHIQVGEYRASISVLQGFGGRADHRRAPKGIATTPSRSADKDRQNAGDGLEASSLEHPTRDSRPHRTGASKMRITGSANGDVGLGADAPWSESRSNSGSEQEASEPLGQSGDGGVDGVINEGQLELDQIYVQAKRRAESSVGRPEIQGFVGALAGRGARRGVFITSSQFSPDARAYVAKDVKDFKVMLIDGPKFAELMVRFGVGVSAGDTFTVQEIDEDFFIDELG